MRFIALLLAGLLLAGCGGGKETVKNGVGDTDDPAQILEVADQYYESAEYEDAFLAYGVVYYNYPTSREYIDAAIGLSRSYGALQNYEKQFDILYTLLRENLIPSKVPTIYNAIAEFYERSAGISEQLRGEGTKDYQTAINYYNKSIGYPNSDDLIAKSLAQHKIGTLYEKLDDFSNAITAHQKTIETYSGTEWALRSEQSIAEIQTKVDRRLEYEQSGWFSTPDSVQTPVDSSITVPDTTGN